MISYFYRAVWTWRLECRPNITYTLVYGLQATIWQFLSDIPTLNLPPIPPPPPQRLSNFRQLIQKVPDTGTGICKNFSASRKGLFYLETPQERSLKRQVVVRYQDCYNIKLTNLQAVPTWPPLPAPAPPSRKLGKNHHLNLKHSIFNFSVANECDRDTDCN